MEQAIPYGARLSMLAAEFPDRPALILAPSDGQHVTVTRQQLDHRSDQAAGLLQSKAVGENSLVIVALPNGVEHYVATFAAWKLGACVLPLHHQLPASERNAILRLARDWRQTCVIADWDRFEGAIVHPSEMFPAPRAEQAQLPRGVIANPGKAIGSGGSTGRPKVIIDPKPHVHLPGHWGPMTRLGLRPNQVMLLTGRLYHAMGFDLSHMCLFEGHTIVVPEKFDAATCVRLIREYQVQFVAFIPIMMQRIAKLPDIHRKDFSSIEAMYHAGGTCPQWLKHKWLDLIAPNKQWELYGSTEGKGQTMIRGDEWLQHPGSVGRPYASELKILDQRGTEVKCGEVGEIYMRNSTDADLPLGSTWPQEPTCEYIGAPPPRQDQDGYVSVGDLGHVDAEGYLFLVDRRVDMIKSGGSNIFCAEVEAVLSSDDRVSDAVVIGVPDSTWGLRVHALIELRPGADLPIEELDDLCRSNLLNYKAPKSYEFVAEMPRDPTGKIRRITLREERASGWTQNMLAAPNHQRTTASGSQRRREDNGVKS